MWRNSGSESSMKNCVVVINYQSGQLGSHNTSCRSVFKSFFRIPFHQGRFERVQFPRVGRMRMGMGTALVIACNDKFGIRFLFMKIQILWIYSVSTTYFYSV